MYSYVRDLSVLDIRRPDQKFGNLAAPPERAPMGILQICLIETGLSTDPKGERKSWIYLEDCSLFYALQPSRTFSQQVLLYIELNLQPDVSTNDGETYH
jgi:hypothetical protein